MHLEGDQNEHTMLNQEQIDHMESMPRPEQAKSPIGPFTVMKESPAPRKYYMDWIAYFVMLTIAFIMGRLSITAFKPTPDAKPYEYKYDQKVYDSVGTVLDQLEQQKEQQLPPK